MKGILTDQNDLKEANTKRKSNLVTSDQTNKDAQLIVQRTLKTLQQAEHMDMKQILKRLMKHVTESHKSAAKAGKELMGLLEYQPLHVWLQVADVTMRPLVYIQIPEVN